MLKLINGVAALQVGTTFRKLGALKPPREKVMAAKQFNEFATVDSSTWKDTDYAFYKSPIRDQGQHGSCTGHAGTTALDYIRRMANQDPVLLSATFPYALVNGGVDNGASVTDVLKVLEQYGTPPDSVVGENMIFQKQIPQVAYTDALPYQAAEAFSCTQYEEFVDAINRGGVVAFGIMIGQNFSRLDANGVAPLPDRIAGGHALCGMGIKQLRPGSWLIKVQNSWTPQWGMKGFCYLSAGHFANLTDGYAIMYAKNNNPPPVVPKVSVPVEKELPDSQPLPDDGIGPIIPVDVTTEPTTESVVTEETAPTNEPIPEQTESISTLKSQLDSVESSTESRKSKKRHNH